MTSTSEIGYRPSLSYLDMIMTVMEPFEDPKAAFSRKKIIRLIKQTFSKVIKPKSVKFVSNALKRGIERRFIVQATGNFSSGTFRLSKSYRKKLKMSRDKENSAKELESKDTASDSENDQLSEYERKRLKNIQENKAVLMELQLYNPKGKKIVNTEAKKRTPKPMKQPTEPPRRSQRLLEKESCLETSDSCSSCRYCSSWNSFSSSECQQISSSHDYLRRSQRVFDKPHYSNVYFLDEELVDQ